MSDAAELAASTADPGPGRLLAHLRSERKLSVADVAQRLKYGVRQIEALEAEDFGRLPGTTFVRGMVRGYAKVLDVDPQPLLQSLERRHIPARISVDLRAKRVPFPNGAKRGTRLYLALSFLALAAVLGVLYEWHGGVFPWSAVTAPPAAKPRAQLATAPAPQPAAAAAAPAAGAPATPTPTPVISPPVSIPAAEAPPRSSGAGRIVLNFDDQSWVEIKDRDGRTLMSQLNPGGTQRVVEGRRPLALVIGNATGVRLRYNGDNVDLKPHVKIEVARLILD